MLQFCVLSNVFPQRQWRTYIQKFQQENIDRESRQRAESRRQMYSLNAQAKALARAEYDRLKALKKQRRQALLDSKKYNGTTTRLRLGSPELCELPRCSVPSQADIPDSNPGGKKPHTTPRHRAAPYPVMHNMGRMVAFQRAYDEEFDKLMNVNQDATKEAQRVEASPSMPKYVTPSVPEDVTPSVPEDVIVEARSSMSAHQDASVQAVVAQPSPSMTNVVDVQVVEAQPPTSTTNEVDVEAATIQPSTSVPNDAISEVANTQIPMSMSNHVIVAATDAQPLPPSPQDVSMKDPSMESIRFSSPTLKDVSLESDGRGSPMSVDVSMELVGNVLPSPPIQNDCFSVASGPLSTPGASSLRIGHVKSSRNYISRPYASRSRDLAPAQGNGFVLDRDQEIAMLDEAAKNMPVFNLAANFSFNNVGHLTTIHRFVDLTSVYSQMQPTEHNAAAAQGFYTGLLPHSGSGLPGPYPPVFNIPIEDPANPLWDGPTVNVQSHPILSFGQQAGSNMLVPSDGRSCICYFSVLDLLV